MDDDKQFVVSFIPSACTISGLILFSYGLYSNLKLRSFHNAKYLTDDDHNNNESMIDFNSLKKEIESSRLGRVYIKTTGTLTSSKPLKNEKLPNLELITIIKEKFKSNFFSPAISTIVSKEYPDDIVLDISSKNKDSSYSNKKNKNVRVDMDDIFSIEREVKVTKEEIKGNRILSLLLGTQQIKRTSLEYLRNNKRVYIAGDAVLDGDDILIMRPLASVINPKEFYISTKHHKIIEHELSKQSQTYMIAGTILGGIGLASMIALKSLHK